MRATRRVPRRAWLEVALWRHGSAGAFLLGALLMTAGLLAWMLQQTHEALALAREAQAQEGRNEQRTPRVDPDTTRRSYEGAQLVALKAVLRASPAPDEVVRHMAALSQSAGIAWAQGDYRPEWHAQTQTTRWQVTQPLRATYPQVRQLIDSVLRAHPGVSLDQMTLHRDNASASQVEVRLRWSIWTTGSAPVVNAASQLGE